MARHVQLPDPIMPRPPLERPRSLVHLVAPSVGIWTTSQFAVDPTTGQIMPNVLYSNVSGRRWGGLAAAAAQQLAVHRGGPCRMPQGVPTAAAAWQLAALVVHPMPVPLLLVSAA